MAMTTTLFNVQKAIYTRLTAAGLTVFDAVPENYTGDYVALGDNDNESLFPTFGRDGRNASVVLRVWTRDDDTGAGWSRSNTIAQTVIAQLHNAPLTLQANTNSYILFRTQQRLRDPDGIWRQAILTFDLLVEE